MNDLSNVPRDRTKKYQIPLTHLEHHYIDQCTDGFELERIYKELTSGEEGSHDMLAVLTLDRIRKILPDSQLLRQKKIQTEKSTVHVPSIPTVSVINGIVPNSNEEWKQFETNVSREFNSDEDEELTNTGSYQLNKRLHLAEQHRLNGNTALKLHNYQHAIDLYTKSITLERNIFAYINRAIAYYKLNDFSASIDDCSHVLSINSKNIDVLIQRARCYVAKQQYDQAREDLDRLLNIDPENSEAQDLMNTLIALGKTESRPDIVSSNRKDPVITSMNIDHSSSNPNSPPPYDHRHTNPFHTSSSNDDEDDMALGDEAGPGLGGNLSEDEGHISRSANVSPTIDDDADIQLMTTQKPLDASIDQSIAFEMDETNQTRQFSAISRHQSHDDEKNELYDYPASSYKQNTMRTNDGTHSSIFDAISHSDFGPIVQSWLRDLVTLQSNRRYYDRPWSKSCRPYALDKIQRDMDKYYRFNDYRNAIEVSKKMLQNGILDYHYYAEYLVETLTAAGKCYLKLQDYPRAIQYTTEALQFDRTDGDVLMCRAKAFEYEKCLLFSYADYARIPSTNFDYHLTQRACEKLIIELNSIEDETWREKLPNDQTDDERCLNYLKLKTNYSEENSYSWHQTHAEQCQLDGCFVLAIQYYTICLELQPEMKDIYLKRAACYLKVFEPQKAISDCEKVLEENEQDFLALYYKASAQKLSREYRLYESTLKECIKLQPNNQIILAEYYIYRHEQIPRKKRRIRTKSIDENHLSYEELEEIRLRKSQTRSSVDSNDIRDQCAFILHLQSLDTLTPKLIEMIVNTSRVMIQTEEHYQQEHRSHVLPFSYIKFCFDILIELTKLPQIDSVLSMLEENYRILLDELVSYYSNKFDEMGKLNRLRRL